MSRLWSGRRWTAIGAVLVLVLAGALLVALREPGGRRITAYFAAAVGVYSGSDVRMLGVKIGTIDSVRPEGTQVRTVLRVNGDRPVPAEAKAVVVAPSVVADRYIQLTPAYTGGPRMPNRSVITSDRTATPLELDQLYDSIKKLTNDLGPNGVNRRGSLSGALETGAENLSGNGRAWNTTIAEFGKAAKTLTGTSGDLFATIRNLQKFTTMIRNNDGQVRLAERQLAEVTQFLADDRDELDEAFRQLAITLRDVQRFLDRFRPLIKRNVDKLASVTRVLVDQRRSLAEAFDVVPLNAGNVLNTYDPATRTLMGRGDLNELSMGGPLTAGSGGGGSAASALAAGGPFCAAAGANATDLRKLCEKKEAGGLVDLGGRGAAGSPGLPLPAVGPVYGSPEKAGAAKEGGR